jgi:hypothetical protein
MSNDPKIRVEFAPGCFDDFEGTQEELDALIQEIQRMAESGELQENATPLDADELQEYLDEYDADVFPPDPPVNHGGRRRRH